MSPYELTTLVFAPITSTAPLTFHQWTSTRIVSLHTCSAKTDNYQFAVVEDDTEARVLALVVTRSDTPQRRIIGIVPADVHSQEAPFVFTKQLASWTFAVYDFMKTVAVT